MVQLNWLYSATLTWCPASACVNPCRAGAAACPFPTSPVADDELLYRRIPAVLNLYDPDAEPHLLPDAFRPNENDVTGVTGLSVYRANYKDIGEAARGREGKRYYVAILRAGDLRAKGLEIVPRPIEGDAGHAEITALTYKNRKSNHVLEWKAVLAQQLCLRVEGPFPP